MVDQQVITYLAERAAAERLAGTWDAAMNAALEKVGVPAS